MLKRICYTYIKTVNVIAIIVEGECGYYNTNLIKSNHIKTGAEAEALVDELNRTLGLTNGDVKAFEVGSMFGWDVPGAKPENWNKDGTPVSSSLHLNQL